MGIKKGMKSFKVPGWGLYEDQRNKPKYGAFQCVPRRNAHKQSLTHNSKTCTTCTPKIVIETVRGLAGCRGDRNIEIVLQARRGHERVFSIQILRCPPMSSYRRDATQYKQNQECWPRAEARKHQVQSLNFSGAN